MSLGMPIGMSRMKKEIDDKDEIRSRVVLGRCSCSLDIKASICLYRDSPGRWRDDFVSFLCPIHPHHYYSDSSEENTISGSVGNDFRQQLEVVRDTYVLLKTQC